MEGFLEVLRQSFRMLLDRPKIFVPKLVSAVFSSAVLIGWVSGFIGSLGFLIFFPFVVVAGAFTPVIVSAMVKKQDERKLLVYGIKQSLRKWKTVMGFALLTFFLAFLASIPASLGLFASLVTGNIVFLAAGAIISLVAVFASGFIFYFIPITVLEEKNLFESLRVSFKTSKSHSREVMLLLLFSFLVLAASSLATGWLRSFGFLVFFTGRIVSSVIGTYLIVVSPQYYLTRGAES
jgi:membrane-anchored glycerophosphoryl diester phosphodiesterase (GDPDase)